MKKASGLKCNFQKLLKLLGFKKDQSEVSKVYVDRSGDAIINYSKNALDYRGGISLITKPISGGLSRDEFYRLLKASLEETRPIHKL